MTVMPARTAKACFHLVTIAALLLVWSGCSRNPDADPESTGEIRGEAISPPASDAASSSDEAASPGDGGTSSAGEVTASPPAGDGATAPETADKSAAAPAQAPEKIGEYTVVGFDKLAGFDFEVTDDLMSPPEGKLAEAQEITSGQIPASVKAYDKKAVALQGYMLPLKVEGGLVTELLIMRDQSMCCYGTVPKINEWVSVKMVAKGVKPMMDQPVTIFGKLKVGEMRENGYLVGIYELDGDKMADPLDM
jgi:hypothetical protein